ncbi:permease prefix domain 1-containing protein [Clostridium sp. JNZ X4-2]
MEKIDIYVDKIFSDFNESDEEIKNLKEEMKAHLYEEVEDLKKQGFSEEKSIDKTLGNFGREKNIVREMNTVWKRESEFTLIILKAAILAFVLGCLFMAFSKFYKSSNVKYYNSTSDYVINTIFKEVINKNNLQKNQVDKILNEFNSKNNNGLYYVKIEKLNYLKYEYKKYVPTVKVDNSYEGKMSEDSWNIHYKKTGLQQKKDENSLYKLAQLKEGSVNLIFKEIAYSLFIASSLILCMTLYNYIGGGSKIIRSIAILDLALTGLFISWVFFPDHIKIVSVSIVAICLILFAVFRIYFIKKKARQKV